MVCNYARPFPPLSQVLTQEINGFHLLDLPSHTVVPITETGHSVHPTRIICGAEINYYKSVALLIGTWEGNQYHELTVYYGGC
jgi:hypothetical protein